MSDQLDRAIADMRRLEAGGKWEVRSYSASPDDFDEQLHAREQVITIVLRRKDVPNFGHEPNSLVHGQSLEGKP